MRTTLKDIALKLGLSKTTVSFVLSGIGDEKGVSKQTQERILEYVKSINYQPNQLAQSLISGVTKTIGVIVPSIGDEFYAKLVKEIEKEAGKKGYIIIIGSTERDVKRETKLIRAFRAKQVDGMIIAPTEECESELKKLLTDNFPFVLVDRICPALDTNYVIINDTEASRILVGNLIAKGRRRIALITTDTKGSAILDRNTGYRMALESAGIQCDPALWREVPREDYTTHIKDVLESLFAENPDMDGIFFTAHYLASETMLYMFKNGMDIDNYGFATIHNNTIVDTLSPKMSIARIPLTVMGKGAVNILISEMKEEKPGVKTAKIIESEIQIND